MNTENKIQISSEYEDLFSLSQYDQSKVDALMLAAKFLDIITRTLEERNISRKHFAALMGTSASWLTQIFRGDKIPNIEALSQMAKVLELTYEVRLKAESISETLHEIEKKDILDNLRKIEPKKVPNWIIRKPDWETDDSDGYIKPKHTKEKFSLPMSA